MSYRITGKRIISLVVIIVVVFLYVLQYNRVNASVPKQKINSYQKKEEIKIENLGYIIESYNIKKNIKGYSDTFLRKDFEYLLVNLTIVNKSDNSLKIPISKFMIRTDLFANAPDLTLFGVLNESPIIKPNTSTKFIIPYYIPTKIDKSRLKMVVSSIDNIRSEVEL